jgi:hypothetical protein
VTRAARGRASTWPSTGSRDHISFGSFVQFGQDNKAALDAYVYTVATEVTDTSSLEIVQQPGRVMLVRVPAASIEDRGAYELFAGLDSSGEPQWSADPAARHAIYEDPDGVGPFPQMAFVPGLDRMVYANQHGSGSGNASMQSLLTMAEAPQPWGPWHVFHRAQFFRRSSAACFSGTLRRSGSATAAADFTLIFSGKGSNDSFNTIDGTFATQ